MTESKRILVTPRSLTAGGAATHTALAPLRAHGFELVSGPPGRLPTEDELIPLLDGAVGWLAGVEPISDRVLAAATTLQVIARNGTGADNVDLHAADRLGIRVLTAPGANAPGVSELALTLALAALRDVVPSDRNLKAGGWQRTAGREFAELHVGVVGYGAIGRRVATLFTAIGCEVRFFDPFAAPPFDHVRDEALDDLAAWSDILSLHTPPRPDGTALVDARLLALMRPRTILVNTARSALVDAEAVADALDSETLHAYAVDAFDTEPPQLDRLLRHERTVMTAHIGGFTDASIHRAVDAAVSNLLAALAS